MAASPQFKIYTAQGEYEASAKHAETAAMLVALLGHRASVRYGHSHTLWVEGLEDQSAAESYDHAAEVMHKRLQALHESSYRQAHS